MKLRSIVIGLALAATVAACSSAPAALEIAITAADISLDVTRIEAKVGQMVNITMTNKGVLDALGEVRYGEWQGKSLKELRLRKLWRTVQERPSQMVFPGGEALRAVQTRAVDAVELLAARHAGQTVALFSHGDVIRVTMAHYLGTPLDLFQRIMIGTASISEINISPEHMAVVRANFSVPPLPVSAAAK